MERKNFAHALLSLSRGDLETLSPIWREKKVNLNSFIINHGKKIYFREKIDVCLDGFLEDFLNLVDQPMLEVEFYRLGINFIKKGKFKNLRYLVEQNLVDLRKNFKVSDEMIFFDRDGITLTHYIPLVLDLDENEKITETFKVLKNSGDLSKTAMVEGKNQSPMDLMVRVARRQKDYGDRYLDLIEKDAISPVEITQNLRSIPTCGWKD